MYTPPHQRGGRREVPRPKRRLFLPTALILCLLYVGAVLLWPLQAVEASLTPPSPPQFEPIELEWPDGTQSALRAPGYGELQSDGADDPIPIASITKIVTALVVLEAKPMSNQANTPRITFTEADVERYYSYLAQEGSVGPVTSGASISQYDAMQIMLIASANNYADLLAIWSYGSIDAYLKAANSYLQKAGLKHTVVADASGFSTGSKSTASDLAKLGELALANTAIAQIVDKPSVTIDGLGTFYSTNLIVDYDHVIGIKTGTTDEAGNCLLYAARYNIAGKPVTIIGATLGAPSRAELAWAAQSILEQAQSGFQSRRIASGDQTFASYQSAWGGSADLIPTSDISEILWSNATHTYDVDASAIRPGQLPTATATLTAGEQNVPITLKLDEPLPPPSWLWRLTHPHEIFAR